MLNFGIVGLTIGFMGLMILILSLHLYSRWSNLVKAAVTAIGIGLCAVTYSSYPGLLGWPAQANTLPSRMFLYAIRIDEPNRIFLWGHDLDAGTANARPRAFELPYTVSTHEAGERASSKLKRGLPVIVERREQEGPRLTADANSTIDSGDLVDFIEAPSGILPDKE